MKNKKNKYQLMLIKKAKALSRLDKHGRAGPHEDETQYKRKEKYNKSREEYLEEYATEIDEEQDEEI